MTLRLPQPSYPRRPSSHRPSAGRSTGSVAVCVLVCGSVDRGDDAAGLVVARQIAGQLSPDVLVNIVGQLDIDDLLAVPTGASVVIVDTAAGIQSGRVVDLDLNALVDRTDGFRPRSSHALEFREVIGLAELIRGRPLAGRIVAVGGTRFGLGRPLSPSVRAALPSFASAVVAAVDGLRGPTAAT
jgi:hydrogenase maturation protease